jgi:hypothetical protein
MSIRQVFQNTVAGVYKMVEEIEGLPIDEVPRIKIKTIDDVRFFFSRLLVDALKAFDETRDSLGLACSGGGPQSKDFSTCLREDCPLHGLCDFLYFSSSNDFWQVLKNTSEFLAKGEGMAHSAFLLEEYLTHLQKLAGRTVQKDIQNK